MDDVLRSFMRRRTIILHYVYLLKLSNGDYYVGSTSDLAQRIKTHQSGNSSHTSKYLPVKLVYYSAFPNKINAEKFEDYLKSGSGIAFRNKHLI